MNEDMETALYTEQQVRISVDEWDDGGVWLALQGRNASMHATLTRAEAQRILKGLQEILAIEVTA
jgi:hypothetical protein